MIRDLGTDTAAIARADVLVIGAGIAGLLIATQVAARGRRVVVLESGSEHQADETHPLNAVEQLGTLYAGAEHGRFRCLGGTSTRWGGAMIPLLRADIEEDAEGAWPVDYDDLLSYLPRLERQFGLPDGPYEAPEIAPSRDGRAATFLPRLAKWPTFRRRNVASVFAEEIRSPQGPEIWLNATVTGFRFAPDGRVAGVEARAPSGGVVAIDAQETVIAAGAIESTRLLLLLDRATGDRHFAPHDVLGRYFHDHLSGNVAEVLPTDRVAMNRVVGFRFEGAGMRNLRFEPAERADVRSELAPCFAHIGFQATAGTGFDAVRELYRLMQQRRLPTVATIGRLAAHTPWLMRAAWWRYIERRLLYPDNVTFDLHMVIEQAPVPDNRIKLSRSQTDRFGQPLAAIDWRVTEDDARRLATSTEWFAQFWSDTGLDRLATLKLRDPDGARQRLADGGGIYHPGGSTRMGRTIAEGVVDGELRCFGIANLSVAATSTFPTGGGANPTMMLMLASLRLADRLCGDTGGRTG